MGNYEHCGKGITMRGIRRAFCDELKANRELVKVVTDAAGAKYVTEIGEIAMKNQGDDLRLSCVSRSAFVDIHLDVQLDKTFGKPGFKMTGKLPTIEVAHKGSFRAVTIAPEVWFRHTGNARYAQNMITFESLQRLASDKFLIPLLDGIARADSSFKEITRPRRDLPLWAILRMKGC